MSNGDKSAQLARKVERLVDEYGLPTFEEYWGLYESTADLSNVQTFYIQTEARNHFGGSSAHYCNVAIIGDGLIVDIEGNDDTRSGRLSLERLDSITSVSIHAGALPGLSSSQGASLLVLADRAHESGVGLHWIAKTEEEEDHLLNFAQSLVQAISKQ